MLLDYIQPRIAVNLDISIAGKMLKQNLSVCESEQTHFSSEKNAELRFSPIHPMSPGCIVTCWSPSMLITVTSSQFGEFLRASGFRNLSGNWLAWKSPVESFPTSSEKSNPSLQNFLAYDFSGFTPRMNRSCDTIYGEPRSTVLLSTSFNW